MTDEVNDVRKELEELRRLKETLKAEIEEIRRDKPRRFGAERRIVVEPPRIDISGLTESLEEMMEGLGEQIRESLKGVEGFDLRPWGPRIFVRHDRRHPRSLEIDSIPPERIAKVINPLGSEERLKILDFLKQGGKTFNELEEYTGRAGSSLTHHLEPLMEAGYVIKGEVRGTYYVTVEGRLAYRLAQWLTSRLEREGGSTTTQRRDESEKPEPERTDWEDWK